MSKNESDSIVFHFCGNELRISRWLDIRIRIKRIFNITQELCCKIDNILLVPFVSSPPAPLIRSARRPLVWSFSIGEYGGPTEDTQSAESCRLRSDFSSADGTSG